VVDVPWVVLLVLTDLTETTCLVGRGAARTPQQQHQQDLQQKVKIPIERVLLKQRAQAQTHRHY
jgi:hypothetical protein